MTYKVGDFVYYKNISMDPEFEDQYGYGIIEEIKDLPKYLGSDEFDTYAVILTKYLEDGTPYVWNHKEVVKLGLLENALEAIKRQEDELKRQLDNFQVIREELYKLEGIEDEE